MVCISPALSFLLATLLSSPIMSTATLSHVPHPPHAPTLPSYTSASGPSHVRTCPAKLNNSSKSLRWRVSRSELAKKTRMEQSPASKSLPDPAKVRADFLCVLRSRRSDEVPLIVEHVKPVKDPFYQDNPQFHNSEYMESAPKGNIANWKDLLVEENLHLYTENSEQGHVPVLILSMKETSHEKKPAVVVLHSTNKCKEWVRPLLEAYASRGYVAIAIDSRYHGERAKTKTTYRDALESAWKKGDTMPFIYDTTWDLIKLADYLTQREDIDSKRIGITGESLGGMHAWFVSAVDTRYAVVVPVIGIQNFRWAVENDKWQARVDSIKPVFEEACTDLGKSSIDKEIVEKVWDRIAPGLASKFDAPYTVPLIAPRPLLVLNGGDDPRCPVEGLEIPRLRTQQAYKQAGYPDNFKMVIEPGVGHLMTKLMVKESSDWLDKYLLQDSSVEWVQDSSLHAANL